MSGKRRPMDVNLSVSGGKHWTREEKENRQAQEVKLPKPKTLTPPKWLDDEAKKLFRKYAKMLLEFPSGIISTLDVGTLARYCDCELAYAEASKHKSVWLRFASQRLKAFSDATTLSKPGTDLDALLAAYHEAEEQVEKWSAQMVKFEKMARSCATEMGMTVSSRCKLVVPKQETPAEDNPLLALQRKYGS